MLLVSVFRPFWRRSILAVFALLAPALLAQSPTPVSDGFDPNINGIVYAVAVLPNGQIIAAGTFSTVWPTGVSGPVYRNNIVRLNVDGSVDATFDPNTNDQVSAVVVQPDGKILIAGKFTTVQPNGAATATTRNHIARLNADGSLDAAFNPNVSAFYDPVLGGSLTPQVNAVVLQSDGRILIGGGFNRVQPNSAATATVRNRIARLNADGTLDPTFDPNANSMVWALALQTDGRILVGGGFTALQPNNAATATVRNRIARLNADGTLDQNFDPNANNLVATIAVYSDGRIAIGGNFTTLQPNGTDVASYSNRIARLLPDGTVDQNFLVVANGNITTLKIQSDGKLIAGGYFTTLQSNSSSTSSGRNFVGRFNIDGSLDDYFNPSANYVVFAIVFQADGQILLGGNFTTLQPQGVSTPSTRNHLARVSSGGALDASFEPDVSGRPLAIAIQSDGKFLVAGTFTSVSGVSRDGLVRLNSDGSVDLGFDPKCGGPVRSVFVQADGNILIGGSFNTVAGVARTNLARLNKTDGTLDTAFNPNPNGPVFCFAQQSDGKIIIGGVFNTITRHNNVDPNTTDTDNDYRARNYIARINLDGTLDDNFDPQANNPVLAIKIQSDGQILIVGNFSSFAPNGALVASHASGIARLTTDGKLASGFDPQPGGPVLAMAIQSDGKILLGGDFTSISQHNGVDPNLTDTDNDRRTRNRIARINADGTLDTTFDPNLNGQVLTIATQGDGKILVGGIFTTAQPNGATDWTLRKYFVRLNADGTVDASYDLGLNERTDNIVSSVVLDKDGKAVLAGGFSSLQPIGSSSPIPRVQIARVTTTGTVDPAFNPAVNGQFAAQVNALALQADGKVVAGGVFNSYGGSLGTNLARFMPNSAPDSFFAAAVDGPVNAILAAPTGVSVSTQSNGLAWLKSDGTLNPAFVSNVESRINGQVNAITVQKTDGKILVGGSFSTYNSAAGSNLVRFNSDGSLDTSFNPNPDALVDTIAVQNDGKILVGGTFATIAGVARKNLARLNTDGTLDTAFDPGADGQISAIIVQPGDNKILIAGYFVTLSPNAALNPTAYNYLARLNIDGTVDMTFHPSPDFQVVALALQADGNIVLGGYFTTLKPNGASATTARNRLARIKADGTLDSTFDPNPNDVVSCLGLQSDGKILIGGAFRTVQPNGASTTTDRIGFARLNTDGTLDTAFDPVPNASVLSIAVQASGKIVISGDFTSLNSSGLTSRISRNHLARINADGSVDSSFDPSANGWVLVVESRPDNSILIGGTFTTLQPNGSVMIGGSFHSVNSLPVDNLALLNNDGTNNTNFQPNPNGVINALLFQPDGKIVVGGAFTTIGGVSRTRLARFLVDNTIDTTFAPTVDGTVSAVARQSDGRLVIGGSFAMAGGVAHNFLARLNLDGTADSSFNATLPGAVSTVLVQSDGKMLVTTAVSPGVNELRRLNSDGSADAAFSLTSNGSVTGVALRTDGVIYAGGTFTTIGGQSVSRLARISANGVVDPSFNPNANGTVNALLLQSDGKLVAGGSFTQVSGLPRQAMVRVSTTTPASETVSVSLDRSTISLQRSGSSPQIIGATFDYSYDGRVWIGLGAASRVGSTTTWQLTGQSVPAQTNIQIRVREMVPSSQNTSSSLFQLERQFYILPVPTIGSPTAVSGTVGTGFFYVMSASNDPMSYYATGLPAGLSIDPSTGIISGTPTQAGTFAVTLGATNLGGSGTVTLNLIVAAAPVGPPALDSRFVNLSTNVWVDPSTPVISGFVITGTDARSVLLRAVGPGLSSFVSSQVLAQPYLQLFNNTTGQVVLANFGWGGTSQLSSTFTRLGAFPLTTTSADAAVVITLPAGAYSLVVSDGSAAGAGGTVLAEIYDASGDPNSGASRLVNISSRGRLNVKNPVLIGGFVVTGNTSKKVLIRGIGPTLANYGVAGVLPDPVLKVFNSQGAAFARNNNWQTPVTINSGYPGATAADLTTAGAQAGAFVLAPGTNDTAVLVTLGPGVYTAQVASATGTTGAALVEVYELSNQ